MNLKAYRLLYAEGADAISFLQGQLTQDVQQTVTDHASLPAAYCNPKGRVISSLRLFPMDEGMGMVLPADQAETVLTRLQRFILRAKVSLSIRDDWGVYTFKGNDAAWPQQPAQIQTHQHGLCWRLHAEHDYWQGVWPLAQAPDSNGLLDDAGWQTALLDLGMLDIPAILTERYVPQMINLDDWQGISFRKGCYVGQEVVARMHYLGRLKRRLYRLTGQGALAVDLPAPVSCGDGDKVGELVTVPLFDGPSWQALAVLQIEPATAATLQCAGQGVRCTALLATADKQTR